VFCFLRVKRTSKTPKNDAPKPKRTKTEKIGGRGTFCQRELHGANAFPEIFQKIKILKKRKKRKKVIVRNCYCVVIGVFVFDLFKTLEI